MVDDVEVEKPKRRKQRKTRGKPTYIDVHVGQRVRQRRILLGYSQERLADALNLTFQQVQKYERGTNRMGASRIFDMSTVLDVPVSYFYQDMPKEIEARNSADSTPPSESFETSTDPELSLYTKRETLELVRYYFQIPDKNIRTELMDLIQSLE